MRTNRVLLAAALAVVLLASSGCGVFVRRVPRPIRDDEQSVPLQGATSLRADVAFGSGELTIRGGASGAMEGRFEYNRANWKPEVDYAVLAGEGKLKVRQPDHRGFIGIGPSFNTWELRLPDAIPTDLSVAFGAGESRLDLRGMRLTNLDVTLGAGETSIDLSDVRTNLTARVEGGAGEFSVRVPRDINVRVLGAEDGLGEVNADGFQRDRDALVYTPATAATTTLEIALRRGVGEVNIITAD